MYMSEIYFFMKSLITVTFKSQEQAGDALKCSDLFKKLLLNILSYADDSVSELHSFFLCSWIDKKGIYLEGPIEYISRLRHTFIIWT